MTVVPSDSLSHVYGVAGWYMVSAPEFIRLDSWPGVVWYWRSTVQAYERMEFPLEPTRGYWVKLGPNHRVSVAGRKEFLVEPLVPGWNQVSVTRGISKEALYVEHVGHNQIKPWAEAVAAGWVSPTIWSFDPGKGRYVSVNTLDPWYGYWVRAYVNCGLKVAPIPTPRQ